MARRGRRVMVDASTGTAKEEHAWGVSRCGIGPRSSAQSSVGAPFDILDFSRFNYPFPFPPASPSMRLACLVDYLPRCGSFGEVCVHRIFTGKRSRDCDWGTEQALVRSDVDNRGLISRRSPSRGWIPAPGREPGSTKLSVWAEAGGSGTGECCRGFSTSPASPPSIEARPFPPPLHR